MQLINGDIKKITPVALRCVQKVETDEHSLVVVELREFANIWVAHIENRSTTNADTVFFTSTNMVCKDDLSTLVYNMQDGKVDGFNIEEDFFRRYKPYNFPGDIKCIEDFASFILYDLFVVGWGLEEFFNAGAGE